MNDQLNQLRQELEKRRYFADESLLVSIHLAQVLNRPLFLEGEPGVGKTEVAKLWADMIGGRLIRVQCYPGIESNEVLYEWNYLKQILHIRLNEQQMNGADHHPAVLDKDLFTREFLIPRPLLASILNDEPVVLLIDEVDRADERFEAFLLEFLSDFQISIPELGTVNAVKRPHVVLTSNRTREVHDALRRRCLYQWIDYPSLEKEIAIVQQKAPDLSLKLVQQMCAFVAAVRKRPFEKKPGLSETLDWAMAISHMGMENLFEERLDSTFGCLFKTREDVELAQKTLRELFGEAKSMVSRLG